MARSGLLSWRGKARAGLEPLLPRRDHDDSIGALIRARFGNEVHERSGRRVGRQHLRGRHRPVQPRMVPQLDVARRPRSQPAAQRPSLACERGAGAGPIFAAPLAGMAALGAGHRRRRPSRRGPPSHRPPGHDGGSRRSKWRVDDDPVDAVVLATPARRRRRRSTTPRRSWPGCWRRSTTPASSSSPGRGRVARPARRTQRLSRAQARPEDGDGGVVRLAEVGPLERRRRSATDLARTRRVARRSPRRRHADRPRAHRGRRPSRPRPRPRARSGSAGGPAPSRSTDRITDVGWPPWRPPARPISIWSAPATKASACRPASTTPSGSLRPRLADLNWQTRSS